MADVLVIDDEQASREAVADLLRLWGHEAVTADGAPAALRQLEEAVPSVVVTDLVMPGQGGLELLRRIRAEHPDVPVIVLTGRGTVDGAVEALREGAFHFIQKPVDPGLFRLTLQSALEGQKTRREVNLLRRRVREQGEFLGESKAMREVFDLIGRVAPAKASVVVTGESGTGKEMVARAIHQSSPRRDKPFVAINCSAIPPTLMESEIFGYERGAFTGADQRRPGCFELADGGTLFLDEIGELPPELQAKFLRVLEEEKLRRIGGKQELAIDVRVVAATNRDLKDQIRLGQFREDLFFRLNVFHIPLPPLRDRPEDIPALFEHFVARFARDGGKRIKLVAPEAMKRLAAYRWPGNIRELRNCAERAVLLCDTGVIEEALLPREISRLSETETALRIPLDQRLRDVERTYIEAMLLRHGGNKAKTAALLKISEKTLYNKLQRWAESDGRPAFEEHA
jgi:DNA-binding NtrC family response regulator